MGQIRPFVAADIPRVADLFFRVLQPGQRLSEPVLDYYDALFFRNPWRDDDELPSLVYEDGQAGLVGFIGVVPRRMVYGERPLRVAISTQFMVAPEWRSRMVGIQLLRRFFAGPQDLSIADNAGDMGRRVWEGLGGRVSPLYGMHWTRPLRPCRYFLGLAGTRRRLGWWTDWLRPFSVIGDQVVARTPERRGAAAPLEADVLSVAGATQFLAGARMAAALRPHYDEAGLRWLLDILQRDQANGELVCVALREGQSPAGWYLYRAKRGAVGEVLQIGASPGAGGAVLDHLFRDAWQRGLTALCGRAEPRLLRELSDRTCFFRYNGPATLLHARDERVLSLFENGDACFSRLDGEWWIRFPGSPVAPWHREPLDHGHAPSR